jgi:uncharacterized membrane protein YfcA
MLSAGALSAIGVTMLGSAFVSGLFGMAGGMILLGVLLIFMDVVPAMVLFGLIQMVSNGWRATLWRNHVKWSIVWRFLVGSTLVFLLMRTVALLPSKATLYFTLGLLPFAAIMLPERLSLDITRRGMPYFAGAVIIVLQLMAGAAGHILDVFFQKSPLDRRSIVATKAVTQVMGHVYRIIYFGSFAPTIDAAIPWWGYVVAVGLTIAGTSLAATVLARMTDDGFRAWSRRVTIVISVTYIARGLWLLAAP